LMEPLPAEYDGNPLNRTVNRNEPYAFINFFGDATTTWDRIVFSNDGSSGFESDNYTTRVAAWDPAVDGAISGVVVAEVTGTTTTRVTKEDLANNRWSLDKTTVGNAPGAPAPPWLLLVAFGAVAIFRNSRKTTEA
ncbi:MAG: Npun_F0296 family exosortase-dependent surface protein, partial [Luteolibacter sp.]